MSAFRERDGAIFPRIEAGVEIYYWFDSQGKESKIAANCDHNGELVLLACAVKSASF